MICLAQLGVIFLLRKSDIASFCRSDILFAFVNSNARSAYHCRRQYHARSAYHSPKANRVGAPAIKQVRQVPRLFVLWVRSLMLFRCYSEVLSENCNKVSVIVKTGIEASLGDGSPLGEKLLGV